MRLQGFCNEFSGLALFFLAFSMQAFFFEMFQISAHTTSLIRIRPGFGR